MLVRVSIGTLAVLGLSRVKVDAVPYTAYLLQYSRDGCLAKCIFCPQSRFNLGADKEYVSRIPWPTIDLMDFVEEIRVNKVFSRICIESVLKKKFIVELVEIASILSSRISGMPLSVATTPVHRKYVAELHDSGVDFLGVGLDAATPEVFRKTLKPYTWRTYLDFIATGINVFGERRVTVHLIRGLGESEEEFIKTMAMLYSMGAEIALFALTPVKKTVLENYSQPDIESYRRIQLVKYLLSRGYRISDIGFFKHGVFYFHRGISKEILSNFNRYVEAFMTTGCPGCNRPFYNEKPRGPYYNIPSRSLLRRHYSLLYREVERALRCTQGLEA